MYVFNKFFFVGHKKSPFQNGTSVPFDYTLISMLKKSRKILLHKINKKMLKIGSEKNEKD
jgi:hypothetical protein